MTDEGKHPRKVRMMIWVFVLGLAVAILVACIIQIRGFNPFHAN
jgi:hypothetical protein